MKAQILSRQSCLNYVANSNVSLSKYSLIAVDEARVIGNDDCREFLSGAATRKCKVILSGNDRQAEKKIGWEHQLLGQVKL